MATGNGEVNGNSHGVVENQELVVPILINNKEEHLPSTFDVINPATGKVAWKSASASKADAARAVEAAQIALPAWRKTKSTFRRDILLKAADILESRGEEYAKYMQVETGSGAGFSQHFNIPLSVGLLKDVAGRITTITGDLLECGEEGRSAMLVKEPYGVVFGIAPWNAPYILGFRAVVYAIAAGNTAVLKGPELAPRCYWAIGQVLKDAGLPTGAVNVLAYRSEDAPVITKSIIENPHVKKVNFTGSTMVGGIIAEICGKNLKPCLMELGGKNSAIVLEDADLEVAAKECAFGSFFHGGQICMSTDRILVHRSVVEPFKKLLLEATSATFPPAPAPSDVLVTAGGVKKTKGFVTSAVSSGANVVYGDLEAQEESNTRMRPVVIEGVKKGMGFYSEEAFGPAVGLLEIGSPEEAIDIINDTGYGLSAAVFTKDLRTAFRVAREIESGAVHINRMTVHDEANLPHGGVGRSGWGRFNATAGIEEFLKTKTVTWMD